MTPYYQDKHATIYNDDCREIIKYVERPDLVITDPPYGMNYCPRAVKSERIVGDKAFDVETINAYITIAKKAAYVFCRWNNFKEIQLPKSVICWVKNNWTAGDLKHEHGRQWEAICFYPKSEHKFLQRIPDVIVRSKTLNVFHPTEKPISLLTQLMSCNDGNSVLDPFMGSGGTLVAAKTLGRKSVGVEIEEKYCEIAAKRLSQDYFDFSAEEEGKEETA